MEREVEARLLLVFVARIPPGRSVLDRDADRVRHYEREDAYHATASNCSAKRLQPPPKKDIAPSGFLPRRANRPSSTDPMRPPTRMHSYDVDESSS